MTPAVVGHTGVVRYAEKLWDALRRRSDLDVRGVSYGRTRRRLPAVRHLPLPLRILHPLWRATREPRVERLVGSVDVVHSMDLVPPPARAALVVSLIDVLPATHPEFYSERARRTHDEKLKAVRDASVIVTCTEVGAAEVKDLLGIDAKRLVVAPLAASGCRSADASDRPTVPPVQPPYYLAVGVLTPRKNFAALASAVAALGPDCPLVVHVGPDGYQAARVRAAIDAADAHRRFRYLGEVDDVTLDALYEGATAVCHPSLAEGFGLVCVEAMSHGVPVVAVDIPAVREVTGDAAILVPPGDVAALADAMGEVIRDDGRREQLSTLSLRRAKDFSWAATADAVVRAYRMAST